MLMPVVLGALKSTLLGPLHDDVVRAYGCYTSSTTCMVHLQ